MAHLGHLYANGAGVDADNATALKWFRAAAEKGHPSALYGLGYMHLAGYGVPKDYDKAFKYFTQAGHGVSPRRPDNNEGPLSGPMCSMTVSN
jgi:SEL1 protein